jgi:hypothetical protein
MTYLCQLKLGQHFRLSLKIILNIKIWLKNQSKLSIQGQNLLESIMIMRSESTIKK